MFKQPNTIEDVEIKTQSLVNEFKNGFQYEETETPSQLTLEVNKQIEGGSYSIYSTILETGSEDEPNPILLIIYRPYFETSQIRAFASKLTNSALKDEIKIIQDKGISRSRTVLIADMRDVTVDPTPISLENGELFSTVLEMVVCEYLIMKNKSAGNLFSQLIKDAPTKIIKSKPGSIISFADPSSAGANLRSLLKE